MSGVHSPVGASGAAQRIQCPASVKMQALYPETSDTEDAQDGDAAHWALARALGGTVPLVNEQAPNGVFLTDEMIDAVDAGYDLVAAALRPFGKRPEDGQIEQMVAGPRIHPEAFGTPDYSIWLTPKHLFIMDFKFGHGYVEHVENAQIIDYAAYLLPKGVDDRELHVTAAIYQPRAFCGEGPWRTWTFRASQIRSHINISSESAHDALGDNPRIKTGPECKHCRARHACEPKLRRVNEDFDTVRGLRTVEMKPADIGLQMRKTRDALARLTAYQSGLEEQALSLVRTGRGIPGWRMESTVGREKWKAPVEQIRAIGDLMGIPMVRDNPITPAQARKAGIPDETVASLSGRGPGGSALVPDDGSDARRVFG